MSDSNQRTSDRFSGSLPGGEDSGGSPRLLERETLLGAVRTWLASDWDRTAGPIIVEGRTGLGKTAALGAAAQLARMHGWAVLRAQAGGARDGVLRSISEQFLDSQGLDASPSRMPGHQEGQPLDRLNETIRRLAADRGVLIAVDDAHLLDAEAVEWLRDLARRPAHRRTRVAATVAERSPQSPLRPVDSMFSNSGASVLTLRPLSLEAVGLLAKEILDADRSRPPDDSFVSVCYEMTRGIPAYIVTLLRALEANHVPPTAEFIGRLETTTSSAVSRSVLTRMSRLPVDLVGLFEAIAVSDLPEDTELLASLTRISPSRIRAGVQQLVAVDLLVPEGSRLVFVPLTRRAVYEEMSLARRSKLHLKCASFLSEREGDRKQVLEHLLATEPGRDEWVARELAQAGRDALQHGSVSQAVRLLRRALSEDSTQARNGAAWLDLVRAEASVDQTAAIKHIGRALEAGVDPEAAAEVALQLTRRVDDFDGRAILASKVQEIAEALSTADLACRVELHVAAALLMGPPVAAAAAERVGASIAANGARTQTERKAAALLALADTADPSRGSARDVSTSLLRAIEVEHLASGDPIARELWGRSVLALARAGQFQVADQLARSACDESHSRGFTGAEAEFSLTLAMSLVLRGSLPDTERLARHALSLSDGRPWARLPEAVACLVSVLIDQGRVDEAGELLERFVGVEFQLSAFEGLALLEQRGRVRASEGRSVEALSDLMLAGRRADELGVRSPAVTVWRAEAALLLKRSDREAEAVRLANDDLEIARAHGGEWVVGRALRILAMVGSDAQRLDRLEQAVEMLEHSPAQLEFAASLTELGCTLRAANLTLPRARNLLRRAADIAFRNGAAPLAARNAAELRLSGARPRRLALTGPGALTASEGRVVALVRIGLTNAEIATRLYVSEKTVEGHLVRAYRKLGVRSRRELAKISQVTQDDAEEPVRHG